MISYYTGLYYKVYYSLQAAEEEESQNQHDDSSSDSGTPSGPDFNYILNMSLWSLTKEKVEELIKQRDAKVWTSVG